MLDAVRPTVVWAQTDGEADQLYNEGVELYNAQQWSQAVTKFQAALELYRQSDNRPSIASSLEYLGNVY